MKKVYLSRDCCFVGYSGGKDSSATLTLLWDAIAELPLEERTKPIHILTSEVGVETPVMTAYISRTINEGYTEYTYLQSWKSFLRSIRNDIRYRNVME